MRLVCGDNNSFQQSEYNLKIANLCRFSHLQPFRLLLGSFMGTGRNFTRARIFSSIFISLLPGDSNWKKEEREKRKNKKKKKKKERKKEGKRGREGNEERFSFIYFCQVSCKVNESPRPKGRKLEKWQPFCLLVFQSSMSRSRVDFNSTFKHSTIFTVKSSVDSQCSAFFSVEMPGIKLTLLNITVSWRRFYVTRA